MKMLSLTDPSGIVIGDRTDLIELVFHRFQSVDSILISGSALFRDVALVSDIDLIVLTPAISIESVVDELHLREGKPVNLTAYHSQYFGAISQDRTLVLYHLRELRKLMNGVIIHDAASTAKTLLNHLATLSVDRRLLVPFLSRIQEHLELTAKKRVYTLELHETIELLFFLVFHHRLQIRYSKHKYLLSDADLLHNPCFSQLINLVAAESIASTSPSQMSELAQTMCVAFRETEHSSICSIASDAQMLLRRQMNLDAVFPLRYAAVKSLRVSNIVSKNSMELNSFRAALENFLMVGQLVPQPLNMALAEAVLEIYSILIEEKDSRDR